MYAIELVRFGPSFGGCLHPSNAIRETAVAKILPTDIVKCFAAVTGSHAVDLNDDESEFGHRVILSVTTKLFRDECRMGAGVNRFQNGVRFFRIEIGGAADRSRADSGIECCDPGS